LAGEAVEAFLCSTHGLLNLRTGVGCLGVHAFSRFSMAPGLENIASRIMRHRQLWDGVAGPAGSGVAHGAIEYRIGLHGPRTQVEIPINYRRGL
jgi:hypothetical protein